MINIEQNKDWEIYGYIENIFFPFFYWHIGGVFDWAPILEWRVQKEYDMSE